MQTAALAHVVSIRPIEAKFRGDDVNEDVFSMEGEHPIAIRWDAANKLVIQRPPIARQIFKEMKTWKDVQIVTEASSGA